VFHLAHVGNSCAYLVRGRLIERLTVSHETDPRPLQLGPPASICRTVLYRFLGIEDAEFSDPEMRVISLQPEDRFLLCTDGLTNCASAEQMLDLLSDMADMQQCAEGLCQLALDQGSHDNISCVVIEVNEVK
jgi:protein phosphatase